MLESDFQTSFTKYLKYRGNTGAYELKLAKGDYINFKEVKDHQLDYLLCAKRYTFAYKISDFDTYSQKPFDCFCLKGVPAYVVIMFYTKKGTNHFYMIDVEDFIKEKENSERKSLTEERASEIGLRCEFK